MAKMPVAKLTAVVERYKYHTNIRNQSTGTAPVTETTAVQKDSFESDQKTTAMTMTYCK
jgi:hypothetical protein